MNRKSLLRVFILGLYTLLLFQVSTTLSISLFEYHIYSGETSSLLFHPLHFFTTLFGQNDMAIRTLMILIHLATIYLYYQISKPYFSKEKDRHLNVFIFILLPGVVSSALIVHATGLVFLSLLFFLWIYQKSEKIAWLLLPLYFFLDPAFFILFLALFLQSLRQKRYYFALIAFLFMITSFYFFGFKTQLTPENFFLNTFAVLSIVFSPILFFYFIYALFRIGVKGKPDFIWMVSLSAMVVALGLSFRQKIPIEQFAPFIVVLLPLMLKQFLHTLRLRIKKLRKVHLSM
ncbi:MAG: hypothetical protein OEW60_07955, partial [Thiovulaceae bacterium]|nr:hypothetical protein [Sulfurimonadaceae bacterium]